MIREVFQQKKKHLERNKYNPTLSSETYFSATRGIPVKKGHDFFSGLAIETLMLKIGSFPF